MPKQASELSVAELRLSREKSRAKFKTLMEVDYA